MLTCNEPINKYSKIEGFLKERNSSINISFFKLIVVLNAGGDCLNCNKKFTSLMSDYIQSETALFIVSDHGANIDISSFLVYQNRSNVILDRSNKFKELGIVDRPAIIFLGDKKVDSIVEINLENLSEKVKEFPLLF